MSVSVSVSDAAATKMTAQSILQTLSGDSFDFGVLAVFSCPDSCPSSSSSFSSSRKSPSSPSPSNDENNRRDHHNSDLYSAEAQTKPENHWASSQISYECAVVQPPADF